MPDGVERVSVTAGPPTVVAIFARAEGWAARKMQELNQASFNEVFMVVSKFNLLG